MPLRGARFSRDEPAADHRPRRRPVASEFAEGEAIRWRSREGTVLGRVVRRITGDGDDDPRYLVRTTDGHEMVRRPGAIERL